MRIKIYNKIMALLFSRTAQMPIGMNTNALFYPKYKERKVLQETELNGYSRVEISFYHFDYEDNRTIYDGYFTSECESSINAIVGALNEVEGLCYKIGAK